MILAGLSGILDHCTGTFKEFDTEAKLEKATNQLDKIA